MILKCNDRKFVLKILGYQYSEKKSVYNSDTNWLKCKVILKSKNIKWKIKDPLLNIDDVITLKKWFQNLVDNDDVEKYFNMENTLFIECWGIIEEKKIIGITLNTSHEEYKLLLKITNKQIYDSVYYIDTIIDKFPKRNIEK